MAEHQQDWNQDRSSGDLEYDMAHERVVDVREHEPVHEPVRVDSGARPCPGSDYGYDMAHEVPGR